MEKSRALIPRRNHPGEGWEEGQKMPDNWTTTQGTAPEPEAWINPGLCGNIITGCRQRAEYALLLLEKGGSTLWEVLTYVDPPICLKMLPCNWTEGLNNWTPKKRNIQKKSKKKSKTLVHKKEEEHVKPNLTLNDNRINHLLPGERYESFKSVKRIKEEGKSSEELLSELKHIHETITDDLFMKAFVSKADISVEGMKQVELVEEWMTMLEYQIQEESQQAPKEPIMISVQTQMVGEEKEKYTGLDVLNGKEMATFPRAGGEEENMKTSVQPQLVGEEKHTGLVMLNGKEMTTCPRAGGEEKNMKTLVQPQLVGEEKHTGLVMVSCRIPLLRISL